MRDCEGTSNLVGLAEIKRVIAENAPFLLLLVGIALVTFSIGPYQNLDTAWEFEASSNVLKIGVPYVDFFHGILNQPPLGFYLEALVFQVFGLTMLVGETFVTLFGLGTVVLVYALGKELYGKSTGLFAAALFGLSPWQLILSRSFLIDAQCLFFSLLCLNVGILAIRKNSLNFTLVSGILFAAAFLTKLYAVFVLIPLLLYWLYSRPKNINCILTKIAVFSIPAVVASILWYQVVLGTGFGLILGHVDLSSKNPAGIVPSYFFVLTFLNDYGIGFFFIIATTFSLFVCLSCRKIFSKLLAVDLILGTTIAVILGIDVALGIGLNLTVPYTSAFKYDYQALPFLSLIAASLTIKSISLFRLSKSKAKLKRALFYFGAFTGAFLVGASLLFNIMYTNGITTLNYLLFRVERHVDFGFGLFNYTPINANSPLMFLQYVGFATALFALFWASRHKLRRLLKQEVPSNA